MSAHKTKALTHQEVAKIMTERGYPMSRQRVEQIEKSAIKKLRESPILLALLQEMEQERYAKADSRH